MPFFLFAFLFLLYPSSIIGIGSFQDSNTHAFTLTNFVKLLHNDYLLNAYWISIKISLITALGGPAYRLTYPNGDQCACVVTVYSAVVLAGVPTADDEETTDVAWFDIEALDTLDIGPLNRDLLSKALPLIQRAEAGQST